MLLNAFLLAHPARQVAKDFEARLQRTCAESAVQTVDAARVRRLREAVCETVALLGKEATLTVLVYVTRDR